MRKTHSFFIALALALSLLSPTAAFAQSEVDKTPPSDVESLKTIPGDLFVSLEWDAATDNTKVTGYKVYYGEETVTASNTVRYGKTIDAGNVLQYIISGLENGKTYYFAVTAYDKAANESEYYSPEVSSTPMAGLVGALSGMPKNEGDKSVAAETDESKILKITKVEAVDSITVKIVLSAVITAPEKDFENYLTIQDNQTLETLKIKSVKVDEEDKEGKTLLVETDIQIPETEYLLTLGNTLTGKNEEKVVSGKDDSMIFKGSALEHKTAELVAGAEDKTTDLTVAPNAEHAAAVATDNTGIPEVFQLKSVTPIDETTLKLLFNKKIILSADPTTNFSIVEKDNPEHTLEIKEIKLEDDGITVTLKTAQPENKIYLVSVKDITDEAGIKIDENVGKLEFTPNLPDTIPPEDVTNFAAQVFENTIAKLTWTASVNTAKDLDSQILYKSLDKGASYSMLKSFGAEEVSYDATKLVPGKEYFFKLTVKDKTGNESVGAVTSIVIPPLPATGPGGILVLALGSAGAALMRKFRK